MAETDIVARVISLVSTFVALVSLLIAVLSYRRGRPRVIVKDARVVTAVQRLPGNDLNGVDDTVMVQVLLVNRGQAAVQLASSTSSGAWPLMAEFQRSRAPGRTSQSRVDRANGRTLAAPLVDRLENDQISGFSGLAISGELTVELLTKALAARLWRMRVYITLSSGDVIFSHWFRTPLPWQGAVNKRQAELRREASIAMNDLARALRESGSSRNWTMRQKLVKRTGLKFDTVCDLLDGRGEPSWPTIAKIVDALEESTGDSRSRVEMWKTRWIASLDAGRWLDESTNDHSDDVM